MSQRLDLELLPKCRMDRVIVHWTAGGYVATPLELHHYHVLIEGSGRVVLGRKISDNVPPLRQGAYAAHTAGCNSYSIGVAVCAMARAREKPFDPGPCPMTEKQWFVMAEVVAELCAFYGIEITPRTVLGHGEVQAVLGIKQAGKWDPMRLPWLLGEDRPMEGFREKVRGDGADRLPWNGSSVG